MVDNPAEEEDRNVAESDSEGQRRDALEELLDGQFGRDLGRQPELDFWVVHSQSRAGKLQAM
jgi:hypothetical protein